MPFFRSRSRYVGATLVAASAVAATLLFSALPSCAQTIHVESGKPGGVYKAGEKIVWHISVTGDGASDISRISYVIKAGQMKEIGKGDLTLQNGVADLEATLDTPGSVLAYLTATPNTVGKPAIKDLAGALIAPEEIKPSAPRPSDFDAFWKSKVEELKKVPMNPVLESGDSGNPNVDYWKIRLDNIRGTHIQGQLARPKAGTKLPALLIVQWAGVYPLQKGWATGQAAGGWLTLNINAHDLPIDQTKEFYDDVTKNKFGGNYSTIGNEDKDSSYFLRMYLSCYRALDYLKSRDDWDGKTLVVMGTSQGGLQTLMIGGLYPAGITALIADVPAGCDQTGPAIGRQAGWPMWWWQTKDRDEAKVREAARYYDVVNFAGHITCPTLIATGLLDQTCPDHGVAAAFNQIKAPKELVVMERAEHSEKNNNHSHAKYYERSNAWLRALAKGEQPPVM